MKSNPKRKHIGKKSVALSPEQIKALPLEKKRQLHLVPQDSKPGSATVRGLELIESFILAGNPDARKEDILLLRAKRAASSLRIANFSDSELRGVSWFAHMPEFQGDITQVIFNERNFYASSFWAAWKHDPATVLKLVKKIRDSWPLNKLVDKGRKTVEAVITKKAKLDFNAADYEKVKIAVKRDRRKLKPPENVAKIATHLS